MLGVRLPLLQVHQLALEALQLGGADARGLAADVLAHKVPTLLLLWVASQSGLRGEPQSGPAPERYLGIARDLGVLSKDGLVRVLRGEGDADLVFCAPREYEHPRADDYLRSVWHACGAAPHI